MNNVIFTSLGINKLMLKNRVIMTAMHLGYPYDKERDFYVERARGGVAAITTVAGVTPEGTYNNMLLIDETTADKFADLANSIHEEDCKLIVQLFCAGRNGRKSEMVDPNAEPVAPSAVPSKIYGSVPHEMSEEEILSTVKAFGKAATICKESGVDCVEISCSAGYLLSEFLSPITNLRKDKYGGNEEKRMTFPMMVMQAVREAVGNDYPVILRISGNDMIGGYDIEYMKKFISAIPKGYIDAVNVTGGWHESSIPQIDAHLPKGGWAILAGEIKKITDLPVIACNRINDEETIKLVLENGLADFVGCARAHLADANFVNKIKNCEPYVKCIGCNRGCIEPILKMKPVQCVMNPLGISDEKDVPEGNKNILVIGAGVAGLTCSKLLAEAGHNVTVACKDSHAGGLVNLACLPPGKSDVRCIIESLLQDLKKLNVTVLYDTVVDARYLEKRKQDAVVVATGSSPLMIPLQCKNLYTADKILTADCSLLSSIKKGKTVIIGGGLVGIETALYLASKSYVSKEIFNIISSYNHTKNFGSFYSPLDITILEMDDKIGKELGSTRFLTNKELKEKKIKTITGARVTEYKNGGLYYTTENGEEFIEADTVICAIGYRSQGNEIVKYLEENNIPHVIVGDARKPANIKEAILGAKDLLKEICV